MWVTDLSDFGKSDSAAEMASQLAVRLMFAQAADTEGDGHQRQPQSVAKRQSPQAPQPKAERETLAEVEVAAKTLDVVEAEPKLPSVAVSQAKRQSPQAPQPEAERETPAEVTAESSAGFPPSPGFPESSAEKDFVFHFVTKLRKIREEQLEEIIRISKERDECSEEIARMRGLEENHEAEMSQLAKELDHSRARANDLQKAQEEQLEENIRLSKELDRCKALVDSLERLWLAAAK